MSFFFERSFTELNQTFYRKLPIVHQGQITPVCYAEISRNVQQWPLKNCKQELIFPLLPITKDIIKETTKINLLLIM